MKKVFKLFMFGLLSLITLVLIFLSKILNSLGLHPEYEKSEYDYRGKKALIITTSHDTLGDKKTKTGVYASEMTVPYYEFLEANMVVDIASIEGGQIPIEPNSIKYPVATSADRRFLKDEVFLHKVQSSLCINDVDFLDYDIIYMAGGWGAAYDLGTSDVLGEKLTQANEDGIVLGSACHGALGFLKAKGIDGEPLVKDKRMTGVTNKQIKELGITVTPMHPETELKKLGADYQSETAFVDVFANLVVVDGNIVTGQNQNAGGEVAQKLMKLLR
jgi:putative intracellular protease/amidase